MPTHLLYILAASIPTIFWIWYFLSYDKNQEPVKLLLKMFFLGALSVVPALFFEFLFESAFHLKEQGTIFSLLIWTFLFVGAVEELLKFYILKTKIFHHKEFDESIDGIVYAVVVALGFATVENFFVVFQVGTIIVFQRFFTATLLHTIATGVMGLYLARAKFKSTNTKIEIQKGILFAIIIHGSYNFIISSFPTYSFPILSSLLLIAFVLFSIKVQKMRPV